MKPGPILLVEDSADDEALILRCLKRSRVANDVIVARDGVEALDYLLGTGARESQGPLGPTVVLLDIKLPRLNGLEVLERIRADERVRKTPVVMLTSSDEEGDKLRSYDLGANSYVRKPVEFDRFADVVSKLGVYWLMLNEPPPAE